MSDSHSKFIGTDYAVELAGCWVGVTKCTCGAVHAYWLLDKELDKQMPRLKETELYDEIRNHIVERLRLLNETSKELVSA